jgi:phage-related protein
MYKVFYYRDRNGISQIEDYFQELSKKGGKDSRIKLNKIYEYIKYLSEVGQQAGEPYVKHIDGDIWELRPIRDRILFAAWDGRSFILLHHFVKKTQKTPKWEIDQARHNLADHRQRSKENE